jgi:hypothetical protein
MNLQGIEKCAREPGSHPLSVGRRSSTKRVGINGPGQGSTRELTYPYLLASIAIAVALCTACAASQSSKYFHASRIILSLDAQRFGAQILSWVSVYRTSTPSTCRPCRARI